MNKAQAFLDQIRNPEPEFPNRLGMIRRMLFLFFGMYTALLFILYIVMTKALPLSENVALISATAITTIAKPLTILFVIGFFAFLFAILGALETEKNRPLRFLFCEQKKDTDFSFINVIIG